MSHYILIADKNVQVGQVIPNVREHEHPNAAYVDPRCIEVTEALHGQADDCLVDMVHRGDDHPVRLVRVTPRGAVRVHSELYDEGDVDPGDWTPMEAEGGWTVEAVESLTLLLGPQGEQVIAAVREGIRVLEDEEDEDTAEAYIAASNSQHETPGTGALHATVDAAEQALGQRDIDGYWWANAIGCCWGNEILALAARDLIGTTPEWTQEAYDVLTLPWRQSLSHPLHADDAAVA